LITTTALFGIVIIAILLALVVYCAYTQKAATVKVTVIKTKVDLQEDTHKHTANGDSQTQLDYVTSKQGLLRRTSIAILANGPSSKHDSLTVATPSPIPSGYVLQPQSRLKDGITSCSISPSTVITEEREKKQSAFLKSSSLSHNDSQLSVGNMAGKYWSPHHNGMASRQNLQTRDNAFATGGSPHSRASSSHSLSIQLPGSVFEEPPTQQ